MIMTRLSGAGAAIMRGVMARRRVAEVKCVSEGLRFQNYQS
jgi:hypothetical protein